MEVDPVFRKEIGWSSYKKVPILFTKGDEGYQSLNDSTMRVSLLASYLYNSSHKIEELVNYYSRGMHDENGKFKYEIINQYFLMFNKQFPRQVNITEEYNWKKWSDKVFVHTFSLNVYRTFNKSYMTFN